MTELIIAMAFAIGVSFICSLLEAVLYSVPLSYIETLAEEGRPAGRILRELRNDIDAPISAILTLNTIAHTVGAAVAGAAAAEVFGSRWLGAFSAVFTFLILVLSEIIPKTAGVAFARQLASPIARPLQWLVWVFLPFVWMSSWITRSISGGKVQHLVSEDDVRALARIGAREGGIDEAKAAVIHGILSIAGKRVHEVMTPRTVAITLSAETTVGEVRDEIGTLNYSRVPVYGESTEEITGVVHRRDILTASADDKHDVTVAELMRPVHFVAESFALDDVLTMFLRRRQHLFVVIDEFGGFSGIITLEDILEEILGAEIVDEFDEAEDMRELARKRRDEIAKLRSRNTDSS